MHEQLPHPAVPQRCLRPFWSLVVAGILCSAWVAAWWFLAVSTGRIPRPFVFWDVALVSILCAVPVGLVIADVLLSISRMLGVLLAGLGLALSGLLFFDLPKVASFGSPWLAQWFWGGMVGMSSAILVGGVIRPDRSRHAPNWPVWSLGILVPLMSIAAFTYTADRARYHERTAQKLLSQSRWQEARDMIVKLQALDPSRKLNDRPLPEIAAELHQYIKSLREDVSRIQAELASADAEDKSQATKLRMRLADHFAMLGEPDEAVKVIAPLVHADPPSPAALNLLGTIRENQERWSESLSIYEQARDGLLREANSSEQKTELVWAWKGIGHASQKQNLHREAEAAYQNVMELEPSAENHYLVAQFYENAQQGDKAQEHAYLAAELDPAFRDQADQLVNDLQGHQFGCWGVFQNRRNLLSR